MNKEELKKRSKKFALDIIKLIEDFPRTKTGDVVGRQLLRSATSVGANYRAACRARSQADFISKLGIVEEESDESLFWLELTVEAGLISKDRTTVLMNEADELTAIFTASRKTAKGL